MRQPLGYENAQRSVVFADLIDLCNWRERGWFDNSLRRRSWYGDVLLPNNSSKSEVKRAFATEENYDHLYTHVHAHSNACGDCMYALHVGCRTQVHVAAVMSVFGRIPLHSVLCRTRGACLLIVDADPQVDSAATCWQQLDCSSHAWPLTRQPHCWPPGADCASE